MIAEAGVNHNGDLNIAKKLVDFAVEAKVDAIKFQTFNPEDLMLKNTPKVDYQKNNPEDNENFYELIKRVTLNTEEFTELKEYCDKKKIIFLSTPFDKKSVELLSKLNVPAYKVGSGDMNNLPLLKLIISKKKPIFLSTGMATIEEVRETVNYIKKNSKLGLVLFQCTTSYPAELEEINLNVIDTYRKEFPDLIIGFSDHSLGIEASIGAATKGVKVIEKHFTLDKTMSGPDHKASLNTEELMIWVKYIRNLEKALGSKEKIPTKNELEIAKVVRKSIVTIKNLKKETIIDPLDIDVKRPGVGIPPKYFDTVIGKKLKKDIPKDSILFWEDFE